jgi:hypothetical protein
LVDLSQETVLGNCIVDAKTVALNITRPKKTAAYLSVHGSGGTMSRAENVCVDSWGVGNLGERRNSSITRELEHVGFVLCHTDVDVSTLQWIHTGSSVDGIFILSNLNDVVEVIWAVPITSKIIQIEPVRFTDLARDNTNTLDVSAREFARQHFQGCCSQIFILTIQLLLLPGHKEIDRRKTTIASNRHVNSSFFERRWWITAVDGDGRKLRSVTVSSTKKNGTGIIRRDTTSRHPYTTTGSCVWYWSTFHSKAFDVSTSGLVPSHHPSGEIPLHAVRGETGVDELSSVKESWSLMVDTSIKASRWVVLSDIPFEVDWEIWTLSKIVDIDRVKIVSSGRSSLGNTR